MKLIRKIVGIFVIILTIIFSLWLGAYVLFAGGIKEIFESAAINDMHGVVIGAVKVWCDWIAFIPAIIGYFIGMLIYGGND